MRTRLTISESSVYLIATLVLIALLVGIVLSQARGQERQGKDVQLICFTATWCPNCPAQKQVVDATCRQTGVRCLYVDIDQSKSVANAYKVTAVPTTFVVVREKAPDGRTILQPIVRTAGISTVAKMSSYIADARKER